MAAPKPSQSSAWLPQADYGGGISTRAVEPVPPGPQLKSEPSQATRALGMMSFFLSGSTAINLSQFLGAPLALINKDWYNTWIAVSKQSWGLLMMTMTQWWAPTMIRVSGDSSMRGQMIKTNDPGLMCDFPEKLVLMANHQIYTDWLYLWWIGYTAGMHGRIFVVLKESLKRIPIIGWGMQFAQFIFLKRNWEQDKPGLAKHMQKLNESKDPMWLMMFPEGTNLASCTREKSRKWAEKLGVQDMKHTLLPRATGLHFMLQELRGSVEYVYDCTIAYEGVPHGEYAQDIFTLGAAYFGGRPPKSVNMYWRRFKMNTIPLDDPKKFELWLRLRWREKDKFIDHYLTHGRFPADTGSNHNAKGELIHGSGHIEGEIKPKYWYEFLQVFAPLSVFAMVLWYIYGSLPQQMVKDIKAIDRQTVMNQLEAFQRGELKVPQTKDLLATAPPELRARIQALQKLSAQKDMTPDKLIAEAKKTLPAGALPAGDAGPKPKPTAKSPVKSPLKASPQERLKVSKESPATSKTAPSKTPVQSKPKPSPPKKLPAKTSPESGALPSTGTAKSAPTKGIDSKTKAPADKKVGVAPSAKSVPKPSNQKVKAQETSDKKPLSSSGNPKTSATPAKKPAKLPAKSFQRTVPSPQQTSKSVDKDSLRHAMKKEARLGKKVPPRKLRRTLEESG